MLRNAHILVSHTAWMALLPMVALLYGIWLQTGVVALFKVNQTVIAETVCMMRGSAENTCQGSCHLSKQLQQTDKGQEGHPDMPTEEFNVQLFSPRKEVAFALAVSAPSVLATFADRGWSAPARPGLLRPPQQA